MAYSEKQLKVIKKYTNNTEEIQVIDYDGCYLDINNDNPDHHCIWLAEDPDNLHLVVKS